MAPKKEIKVKEAQVKQVQAQEEKPIKIKKVKEQAPATAEQAPAEQAPAEPAPAEQTKAVSIVLIETNGTIKTLKTKEVSLDTLYKKCGFRVNDDFLHGIHGRSHWKGRKNTITSPYGAKRPVRPILRINMIYRRR